MVSLTINIEEDTLKSMETFNWVNWSSLAREEIRKKVIFEKYMEKRTLGKEDAQFCEDIDWHPVDELPLKKSFVKKLQKISKGPHIKFKNMEELRKMVE
jgi:hypothetical protein